MVMNLEYHAVIYGCGSDKQIHFEIQQMKAEIQNLPIC